MDGRMATGDRPSPSEVVRDSCMKCGRPWDGRTLEWCPKCQAYTRFEAQTYVAKSSSVPCDDAAIERATDALLADSGLPRYGGYRANIERRVRIVFMAAGRAGS